MSYPYICTTPLTFQPTPHLDYTYVPPHSPFVPSTTFASSPLPTSAQLESCTTYPQTHGSGYCHDDTVTYHRPLSRRLSWHAGMSTSPYAWQTESPYCSRRRSYSNLWGNISNVLSWTHHDSSHHIDIHPLLNGDTPYSDLYFDLSSPTFSPMHRVCPEEFTTICSEELYQPATNPSITRMRITHHSIPQWPIDLKVHYYDYHMAGGSQSPITVGDVLHTIYNSLHRQITHSDWYHLGDYKQDVVAQAYHRRCRNAPCIMDLEAIQGVKRVDYLKERYIFRGLVKVHDEEGFFHWELLTGRPF